MIQGDKISLRALERDDLPQLQKWRNREEFRRYFREYRELSMENQSDWFDRLVIQDHQTLMFGIVDNESGKLAGATGLCYIDWVNRNADLSLYIGWKNLYIDTEPEGYAWACLNLLCTYAFNTVNLHKLWTEIYSFDKPKHILYENYGLKRDAILRDNCFCDGQYHDSYIYSLLAHEWRNTHT